MTGTATRYLHLVRHGEAAPDGSGLTDTGERQAVLLGRRLRHLPVSAIHHGPLPRAALTARLIGEQLPGVPVHACEAAGDYVPYLPEAYELPKDGAGRFLDFLEQFTPEDRERGPALAREAVERFTGPVRGDADRHEVLVTHNFLIGWLVRHAMDAPNWRWLGLDHANAALTAIRYAPDRPAALLFQNDMRHLPADLRWTGFPAELHL
ncbi:histidine phosphatase family protein [Streptomyces sp. ISL-11]|uniref:histidine phosphatase family protein n=1 Tax=Streptomyces sp. ISL-11 TaxID=2819174 RepID=UPI001BEAB98A|nr:histidine phosphatase family protein [Streptomyces sp. ISL-11]MBT2384172.1 histidine phosphatase family protein [Streptomyces sp. ISL-11]